MLIWPKTISRFHIGPGVGIMAGEHEASAVSFTIPPMIWFPCSFWFGISIG